MGLSEDSEEVMKLLTELSGAGTDEDKSEYGQQHKHVLDQLLGKSWGELEVIENNGKLLFPEHIYRRAGTGKFEEEKVLLRTPNEREMRVARVEARKQAVKEGLDLDRDRDLVDNLETSHILAVCIRNASPGKSPDGSTYHEPLVCDAEELEQRYERATLTQVWAKIDALSHVLDPRPDNMSKEELLALIAAIAKERNIRPLVVYGAGAQNSFVVSMATLLMTLLASRSSSVSSAA